MKLPRDGDELILPVDDRTLVPVISLGNLLFSRSDLHRKSFFDEDVVQEASESCRWLVRPKPLEDVLIPALSVGSVLLDMRHHLFDEVSASLDLAKHCSECIELRR